MDQMSFGDSDSAARKQATRREVPLAGMEQVVPWSGHLMLNGFRLSAPVMEEALREIGSMRLFARRSLTQAIPRQKTILNFRRLIEANGLAPAIFDKVNAHLTRRGLTIKRSSMVDATRVLPTPLSLWISTEASFGAARLPSPSREKKTSSHFPGVLSPELRPTGGGRAGVRVLQVSIRPGRDNASAGSTPPATPRPRKPAAQPR
jgi:hypothetical protein